MAQASRAAAAGAGRQRGPARAPLWRVCPAAAPKRSGTIGGGGVAPVQVSGKMHERAGAGISPLSRAAGRILDRRTLRKAALGVFVCASILPSITIEGESE